MTRTGKIRSVVQARLEFCTLEISITRLGFAYHFRLQLYINVLRNWMSLTDAGRVRAILYVTPHRRPDIVVNGAVNVTGNGSEFDAVNRTVISLANELGWHVLDAPRVSPSGVPYFKDMFANAATHFANCTFYGYSNGDILFTDGLIRTLDAVAEV